MAKTVSQGFDEHATRMYYDGKRAGEAAERERARAVLQELADRWRARQSLSAKVAEGAILEAAARLGIDLRQPAGKGEG